MLFLYESGVMNFFTHAIFEEAIEPAMDAAHGELQSNKVLKTSGDPILKNLAQEERRQVEMSVAVLWEGIENQMYRLLDERDALDYLKVTKSTGWGLWYEWTSLRQDAEVVTILLMVFDHILDNHIDVLKLYPAVHKGLFAMQAQVKRRLL